MGRGRGKGNDARTVLLGGKKRNREIFIEEIEGDKKIKTFIDTSGSPIIRRCEEDPPVIIEENTKNGNLAKIFIYEANLDYDPIGDSVIRKTVETLRSGGEAILYSYSDDKLLIRNESNKDLPIKRIDIGTGIVVEGFQWKQGDDVIGKEIETIDEVVTTTMLLNGVKHNLDGLPAVQQYSEQGVLLLEEYWLEGNVESVDDQPSIIEYWDTGQIKRKTWLNAKGEQHRAEDASNIQYWQDGSRHRADFRINGSPTGSKSVEYESSTFFD